MKTEEEELRDIFGKNMGAPDAGVPDFGPMWEEAKNRSRNKGHFAWKIAASITLILIGGAAAVLYQRGDLSHASSTVRIESWAEPTKGLIDAEPGSSLVVLTKWSSPTDFLLPQSNQSIK